MDPEEKRPRPDFLIIVPLATGVFLIVAFAAFGLMYLISTLF